MKEGTVFIRWNMNADSWSGTRTMIDIHKTLEGAIAAVDDDIKKAPYIRPLSENDKYVANFTYEAISEENLLD